MTKQQLTFNFLDAPMGEGKTTAIINMVKTTQQNYLIVTPYTEEVTRICNSTGCLTPTRKNEYQQELTELAYTGKNLCCTHSLFAQLGYQALTALAGYSLIIDEEPETISVLGYPKEFTHHDMQLLIEAGYIGIEEDTNSLYAIKDKQCQGALAELYDYLCSRLITNDIYLIGYSFVQCRKVDTWENFKDITICSYRMENSLLKAYCELNTIATHYQHIDKGVIAEGYLDKKPANLHRLKCYTPQKLNCSCSLNWYQKHTEDVKTLVSSFDKWRERHIQLEYRKGYFWTTFKAYKDYVLKTTKKITQKKFVACNAKATNKYRDCHVVGVFMQRFLNVPIAQFFKAKGVTIDEREYALSELLQFVWRSNIRTEDNTPVFVFIGSRDLYNTFMEWAES